MDINKQLHQIAQKATQAVESGVPVEAAILSAATREANIAIADTTKKAIAELRVLDILNRRA